MPLSLLIEILESSPNVLSCLVIPLTNGKRRPIRWPWSCSWDPWTSLIAMILGINLMLHFYVAATTANATAGSGCGSICKIWLNVEILGTTAFSSATRIPTRKIGYPSTRSEFWLTIHEMPSLANKSLLNMVALSWVELVVNVCQGCVLPEWVSTSWMHNRTMT